MTSKTTITSPRDSQIKPTLSTIDAGALIVGMVVGVGIFETPALVAANTANSQIAIMAWILGGIVSLLGALCYAELATTYPHAGGTYYYLQRAFGPRLAFLFAWSRMTVIQTGSIALLTFVFGDYASQVWRLGEYSSAIYASMAIALLTVVNILGIYQGKLTQNLLTLAKILGILLVIGVGLFIATTPAAPVTSNPNQTTTFGLAMVFVLLTYGGWNEAAYLSAEVRNAQKNMVSVLLGSILAITLIYLLMNWAYLHGLGLAGMANTQAPAAELMRRGFGETGAKFVSFLIAVSAFGAANATVFTGARSNYALGQDFQIFAWLGRWSRNQTPTNALIVQGIIAILLVGFGAFTRNGFKAMVDYTAPVFWLFFLLSGIALFVLRDREPRQVRPFRVPLYPIIPLLFCATCAYLLYSSVNYTGMGGSLGLGILIAGIPILFLEQQGNLNP
ncbi:APC family permease [Calothrix sp. NIES-3974]|uniref:APC family permease n=1 Tax=Calothrix sp. NIES-3974 TaxID=2005462 RepID=UPI000B5DEF8B|nr:amino acid permease [Calothrix sp. NIES-3974]BAZ07683.1 amino acid permease-associated region [Calothrix sp. NIES-3974]